MKRPRDERALVRELIRHYIANQPKLQTFLGQLQSSLVNSPELSKHIHSFKWRLKDPTHLREKLWRKMDEARKARRSLAIDTNNLFFRVTDLVGIRILHLHTRQVEAIDRILKDLLKDARFRIIEGPFARTWDDESKEFFKQIGIKTRQSGPSMYTSVHYVVDSNSRTRLTAEIQVRTLAEELWGEVTHVIDYPKPCKSLACKEQIRVLARVTSSCSRLVDAIFRTHEDFRGTVS